LPGLEIFSRPLKDPLQLVAVTVPAGSWFGGNLLWVLPV
jgi:hypothetical protein